MPPAPPVLFRRARGALSLVLLAAAAGALYGFAATVQVVVDGETLGLRTYAGTVADVIEELEVEVGPADEVHPDPSAPVENGLEIEIARAITVEVVVDAGVARRITAPVGTVSDVLRVAEMEHLRHREARIEPGWWSSVDDGDVVRVSLPTRVWVAVDGEEIPVKTYGEYVEAALFDAGVELGPRDIVVPGPDSFLVGPTTIVVQRVEVVEDTEEVILPRGEVRRNTTMLRRGVTRVDDEGRDGLRLDTYRVTLVDGEEVERELLREEVVREPEPTVVLVGTYVAPAVSAGDDSVWDRLARCESGGNWRANYGNGYYGGLQFHPQTWRSVGGTGLPHEHPREVQIEMGKRLQARSGWGQWPACSRLLGLR